MTKSNTAVLCEHSGFTNGPFFGYIGLKIEQFYIITLFIQVLETSFRCLHPHYVVQGIQWHHCRCRYMAAILDSKMAAIIDFVGLAYILGIFIFQFVLYHYNHK